MLLVNCVAPFAFVMHVHAYACGIFPEQNPWCTPLYRTVLLLAKGAVRCTGSQLTIITDHNDAVESKVEVHALLASFRRCMRAEIYIGAYLKNISSF